ncbi:MAG: hypothetical protein IPG10_18780 [Flavobacteriales bacterium]|nr:hypothetical protein [Flavobacteriales bacterium]MBK6755970.1 hypothetical protein [Flavobacteriales bacterium]MBK9073983.1 hypothetical protein [Flavobacteriales bacterium]
MTTFRCFLAMLVALPCVAQTGSATQAQVRIQVGEPYIPLPKALAAPRWCFLGQHERICLTIEDGAWRSQRLDLSTLKGVTELSGQDLPKDAHVEMLDRFGDRLLMFYSWWDGEAQEERLAARVVDMSTGRPGQDVLSISVHGKLSGYRMPPGAWKSNKIGKYRFLPSNNEQILHITYSSQGAGLRDRTLLTLDTALNHVESPFHFLQDPAGTRSIAITFLEDGSEVRAVRDHRPERNREKKKAVDPFSYALMRTYPGDTAWTTLATATDDAEITSGLLYQQDDGAIVFATWYTTAERWHPEEGFLLLRAGGKETASGTLRLPMPDSLLLRGPLPTEQHKVKFGAAHMVDSTKQVTFVDVLAGDTSHVLVAEQRWIENGGQQEALWFGNTDDLFLCAVNAAGRVLWTGCIPKRQRHEFSPLRTFLPMYYAGEHLFIRFDRMANMHLPVVGEAATTGPRVLMVDRFDAMTGRHARELIADPSAWKIDGLVSPKVEDLFNIDGQRVLLMCSTEQGEQLPVVITFEP